MPAPTVDEKVPTEPVTTVDPKEANMKDSNQPTTENAAEAKAESTSGTPEVKPTSEPESNKTEAAEKQETAQESDTGIKDSAAKEENGVKSDADANPAQSESAKVASGDATSSDGAPETTATEEKKNTEKVDGVTEKTDADAANLSAAQVGKEVTEKSAEKTSDGKEEANDIAKLDAETKPDKDGDANVEKTATEEAPAPTNGKEEDPTKQDTDEGEKKMKDAEREGKPDETMADKAEQQSEDKQSAGDVQKATEKAEGATNDSAEPQKVRFGAVEERMIEEEEEEYKPEEDENEEVGDEEEDEEGEIVEGDEPMIDLEGIPESLATTLFQKGGVSGLLHAHTSKGDVEELHKLLGKDGEMEGKVDDRDVFQYTALHVAAENDKKEACEVLLGYGADISAATKLHGSKPIHYAAFEGHDEIIDLLLDKGADINSLTDDKRTPLYQAAMRGHDHCVKLLLERGANRDLAAKNGKKPEDVAEKKAVADLFVAPPTKKARKE